MLRISTQMTGLAGAPYFSTQYTLGTEQAHADLASDAILAFWTGLVGWITGGLTITVGSEVEVVNPTTGLITGVLPVDGGQVVSTGNAPLPKATQGLLRLRTNGIVAGRRVQGRIFIPALANDAQVGGVPSNGFVADLTADANTLIAALDDGGVNNLAVWSRPAPDAPGGARLGSDWEVSSASVWSQFAVLRSRRD